MKRWIDAGMRRRGAIGAVALCMGLWPIRLGAQTTQPEIVPPLTQPATTTGRSPEYAHGRPVPPDLLKSGTPNAIILPTSPADADLPEAERSSGMIADVAPPVRILPEGYVLARRSVRFVREEPWLTLVLDEEEGLPNAPPLRVLPNWRLTMVERVLADAKPDDRFLVTGRVTEFLGQNYVLLEQAITAPRWRDLPSAKPIAREPVAAAPSEGPAKPARPPTAAEILEQLTQEAPGRPTVRPLAPMTRPAMSQPAASVAGSDSAPGLRRGAAEHTQPEGTLTGEFPARLIRGEGWWTLAHETQSQTAGGKPYLVLPNRLLEVMVSASAGGTRSMVFLVSGELTEYRGANYLLVRKVLVRRDLGNVR